MSLLGSSRRVAADFLMEQMQMDGLGTGKLSEIFEEEPPPLDVFLYDKKYLNHLRPTLPLPDENGFAFELSPIQYDFVRNFEQIFYPELYISMVEEFGTYWSPLPMKHMFALEWGKAAGKDTSVRIGFVRIANLLSCMHSPQSYYNMAAFDTIQMLNVAATAQQARDAFFDPMKKLFIGNKYLSSLFKGDDPAEGANRLKLNKNITIISGNSMAENQEGLNLIAGVADEISAFKVAEEYKSKGDGRSSRGAEQIVNLLRSSSATRFPKSYKVVQISWPRFSGDAIEKAIAAGRASQKELGKDESAWYVSGPHATWEVRPSATKESFREHYMEDPEMAASMYECKPPKATNAFIRDELSIDMAFEEIKEDPILVDYYWGYPPDAAGVAGPEAHEGWQVKFTFSQGLVPVDGALYCMHGDLAIKGDRAGIAMSHVKSYRPANGDEDRPIVKNDFVFTFESDLGMKPPREVQIRWYRQLIWELVARGFTIVMVTFDQFQSFDMMQTLEMHGIESGPLSLDRNDRVYQSLKDVILDGRLESYRPIENADPLVVQEIKRLRRVGKNKVDHPPSFSKDASDSLAGSVWNAIEVGGEEDGFSMDFETDPHSQLLDTFLSYGAQSRPGANFGAFGNSGPSDIMNLGYFHR